MNLSYQKNWIWVIPFNFTNTKRVKVWLHDQIHAEYPQEHIFKRTEEA